MGVKNFWEKRNPKKSKSRIEMETKSIRSVNDLGKSSEKVEFMISKTRVQHWPKLDHNFKKDQGSKILSGMNSSSNDLKFLICHLQTYKKEISKNDGLIFPLKNIFWVYVSHT